MEAQERREKIARRLEQADGPVSATALAKEFSVSRQIIVGDVALLRAAGLDIAATPRGYILPPVWEGCASQWPAATAPRIWSGSSTPSWTRAVPFWT